MSKNPLKSSISWKYFFTALSCVIFFIMAEMMGGVRFNEIFVSQNNISYLMVILYTLIAILFIGSVFKMFTNRRENKESKPDFLVMTEEDDTSIENLLFKLEKALRSEMDSHTRMMNKREFYARIFTVLSLVIPGISWTYLFFMAGKNELPNLGFIAFSSMAAVGVIGLTTGITWLKHAKSIQPYIEKLNDEILHLRKLRIVCLGNLDVPEIRDLRLKVVEALLDKNGNTEENKPKDGSEGGGNAETGSLLVSSFVGGERD
jgi:uncharacterized membrane protein